MFADIKSADLKTIREDVSKMVVLSREAARTLIDDLPESPDFEDLTSAVDEAQGDATDETPSYLIIKITG
jgi:hypothetical protein